MHFGVICPAVLGVPRRRRGLVTQNPAQCGSPAVGRLPCGEVQCVPFVRTAQAGVNRPSIAVVGQGASFREKLMPPQEGPVGCSVQSCPEERETGKPGGCRRAPCRSTQ